MSKPYSQACENNKRYILEVISTVFRPGELVLEIGSATAQHVCYFAARMPDVNWLPSDTGESLPTVLAGLEGEVFDNLLAPLELDVRQSPWPVPLVDGIFSANCLHIMSMAEVGDFYAGAGRVLKPGGALCVYGPFKYAGDYTSASNAEFDRWLKHRDPDSGIRDFEQVDKMARDAGLAFVLDHTMPANNQLVVWRKPD